MLKTLSIVTTKALVLKHHTHSIDSADEIFIVLDQFHIKYYTEHY